MTLHTNQPINLASPRSYNIEVPVNPPLPAVPAIIVFHGGGQEVATIAKHWGVNPPAAVPAFLQNYLLVFPESHPRMGLEWQHFTSQTTGFPTLDLEFVRELVAELTTRAYPTGGAGVQNVSADPNLIYAAGFSNGGGMVWQLLNSDLSADFRGYAMVGKALDPEKSDRYRRQLAGAGQVPAAAPVFYLQGTAERGYRPPFTQEETPLQNTLPFNTLREMLIRNGIPAGAATTRFIPGSTGLTEVVVQLFTGGTEAYAHGTVMNGGHNWPTPTTVGNPPVANHFDATEAIVEFWHLHAGLPI